MKVEIMDYWKQRLGENECQRILALPQETVLADFEKLAGEWKRATSFHSNTDFIFGHPIYRRFVLAGEAILPVLREKVQENPIDWAWAIEDITHPPDAR